MFWFFVHVSCSWNLCSVLILLNSFWLGIKIGWFFIQINEFVSSKRCTDWSNSILIHGKRNKKKKLRNLPQRTQCKKRFCQIQNNLNEYNNALPHCMFGCSVCNLCVLVSNMWLGHKCVCYTAWREHKSDGWSMQHLGVMSEDQY